MKGIQTLDVEYYLLPEQTMLKFKSLKTFANPSKVPALITFATWVNMFNIRRFDDVCWPKQSWTFDYILLPEQKTVQKYEFDQMCCPSKLV